jgi:1-deoxy-D-xylulose-5-phosphate reductoisomerase
VSSTKTNVAVFGASGSIGSATIDVLRQLGGNWRLSALSVHSQVEQLASIATEFESSLAIATDLQQAAKIAQLSFPKTTRVLVGPDGLFEAASDPQIGTVVAAMVGAAGLECALVAAQSGKRLALANKESLVVAGDLLTQTINDGGGELIPIDSEHSAVFQAMQAGGEKEVKRVILTASGGPFRTWDKNRLAEATIEDALAHPTWQMGRKITIDSATMMNKALEVIEAKWLFDLSPGQIEVVIHPQSIVHSMVEFVDGSVVAQLSPPDMRLPIQYALTYPDRLDCPCSKMDWTKSHSLEFLPVDLDRYPALQLGMEVASRGGTSGAVLNAANEAAVERFLTGQIRFTDIVEATRQVLNQHNFSDNPTLEELMRQDRWARTEITRWTALR